MPALKEMLPSARQLATAAAVLVAIALSSGCGDGPNAGLLDDARAAAEPVIDSAPAAFDEVIAAGATNSPKGRDQLREQIEATSDALITRASLPFDAARAEARANGNAEDELFEEARGEAGDLIIDAQDEALAEVDALDP